MSQSYSIAAVAAAALLLTACGAAEPPKTVETKPPEKGIFISTSDCADSGKLSAELCGQAIDMAVANHEQNITAYKSLRLCAAAQGPDRCIKSVDGLYRPTLQAFLVIMSTPPVGGPLYPTTGTGTPGFRTITKVVIDPNDENYTVSSNAMTIANENAKLAAAGVTDGGGL